jgi:hypothetical protein
MYGVGLLLLYSHFSMMGGKKQRSQKIQGNGEKKRLKMFL